VGVDSGETRELEVEIPGLTSTTAGVLNELFFDKWEMVTNESSDTIFTNPLIIGGASPVLNYNDKVVLSRLARDGGTIQQAVSNCNSDLSFGFLTAPTTATGGTLGGQFQPPGISSFSSLAAVQLQLEIFKGQIEYKKPTRVLRHTSYCSPNSNYNANIIGENLIYTTSQLLTEISSGWTYNCPNRIKSKIGSIPFQTAPSDEAAYYTFGWLKTISREPVLSNFMVEVNVEFENALWSNLRYGLR
jgi:hypothetical protein